MYICKFCYFLKIAALQKFALPIIPRLEDFKSRMDQIIEKAEKVQHGALSGMLLGILQKLLSSIGKLDTKLKDGKFVDGVAPQVFFRTGHFLTKEAFLEKYEKVKLFLTKLDDQISPGGGVANVDDLKKEGERLLREIHRFFDLSDISLPDWAPRSPVMAFEEKELVTIFELQQ